MTSSTASYQKRLERSITRSRAEAKAAQEIGPIPPVKDHARRLAGMKSLEVFGMAYFPGRFFLGLSEDHRAMIAALEEAAIKGGLLAVAIQRGGGKTTWAETATIWSTLIGAQQYSILVAVNARKAAELLTNIKTEFEGNDLLAEDWPEVCYPIRALEGEPRRCLGQLCRGQRTHVQWGAERIVLPTIPGSQASGAVIETAGLTGGRLRGPVHTTPSGRRIRPTLVIFDDPQNDSVAYSPTQVQRRERLIDNAVMGLAGPGRRIAAVLPCTVIAKGDLSDRFLDAKLHPEWRSHRCKMVIQFPSRMDLWGEYRDIMITTGRPAALGYYREHQQEMDSGALLSWTDRKNADDLSAVQHAMDKYLSNPVSFLSEFQNDPADDDDTEILEADIIAQRLNHIPRGTVPAWAEHVVCHIDVAKNSLWWMICAFQPNFTGAVVDYGVWPEQRARFPKKNKLERTFADVFPSSGQDGQVRSALDVLVGQLLSREWKRDGGGRVRIDRLLVDRGWLTTVIDRFCREHANAPIITPSKGRGITASRAPMSAYKRRAGEKMGENWIYKRLGAIRWLDFDANAWKSFVAARLTTAIGDPGSLTFFGGRPQTLLADHFTAETFKRKESDARVVDEWHHRPDRPDNEFWDNVVACHVAASMCGASLSQLAPKRRSRSSGETPVKLPRRSVTYLDL